MGAPAATERFPTRLIIGGEAVESASGRTFAVINPATEEEVAAVAEATGTVTAAVMLRATRMRKSPFSTSISVRSASARRFASSRTRFGSNGLASPGWRSFFIRVGPARGGRAGRESALGGRERWS